MLHLLQADPFKVLTTLLLQVQCSRKLSFPELSSFLRPFFSRIFHIVQHCYFLFRLFQLVYLHCSTWFICPPLPMQDSHSTLAYQHITLLPPTLYILPLHPPHPFMFLEVLLYLLLPLPLLIPSEFFNRLLEVFESEALNFSNLSHLILWILSVSRNPTYTCLPFS